ncbi:MAG: zinc ribbon domain-containing protein [Verrucomicrobiae bacterium]|nr:zinc ribbon domain-containing protein [Verrucomicrobiae bacterium]MDW8345212.1 hypothetical protein [Verrucomicrobiae bacterium]
MNVRFRCRQCRTELEFDVRADTPERSPCPQCGAEIGLRLTDAMRRHNQVDRCAVCDCPTVYVQKDFNRAIGVGIFLTGAALFLVCAWFNRLVEGTLVWAAFVAADALLYKWLPEVTICYKCHAQYRDVSPNPHNRPFELGLAEKYDPLDKRVGAENPAAEWRSR